MTVPYAMRLVCLSLAVFFLVHSAAAGVVRLFVPILVRRAERMNAARGARFLMFVRLLPATLAAFVVAALCAPSYLWLEPSGTSERMGAICLAAAALGAALWVESAAKGLRAVLRSGRYLRRCRATAEEVRMGTAADPILVVPQSKPVLALAGVWRTRLVLSQAIVDALPGEQLRAALRHEDAHRESRDNMKRLLLLLAPGVLPGLRGFDALEMAWARLAEWAADDRAVAGDSQVSISLAEALVRVARLGAAPSPAPLATSLLADGRDLAERVERLLRPTAPASEPAFPSASMAMGAGAALMVMMLHPAVLHSVHSLLERLNY